MTRTPRFHSLAHYSMNALKRALARIRKDAATGVDGVSKGAIRAASGREHPDLNREAAGRSSTGISLSGACTSPRDPGKTRPIGISTVEDKIVQGALTRSAGGHYEQDFLPGSYGFRPDAARTMRFEPWMKWRFARELVDGRGRHPGVLDLCILMLRSITHVVDGARLEPSELSERLGSVGKR